MIPDAMTVASDPSLDGANPFTTLLHDALASLDVTVQGPHLDGADLLHLHWPDLAVAFRDPRRARRATRQLTDLVESAERRQLPVVWTVHNVRPHERHHPLLARRLYRTVVPSVTAIASLSRTGLEAATKGHPTLQGLPRRVVPHGSYEPAYGPLPSRPEAIDRLRLGRSTGPTLTLFGNLRPYKGAVDLMRSFSAAAPPARLLIAGRIRPRRDSFILQQVSRRSANTHVMDRRLTDAQLLDIMTTTDICVLPYRRILHSGAAHLALSYGKRVVAPKLGAFPELANDHPGWLTLYEPPLTPSVIAKAVEWAMNEPPRDAPALPSWTSIAQEQLLLYREALAVRGTSS